MKIKAVKNKVVIPAQAGIQPPAAVNVLGCSSRFPTGAKMTVKMEEFVWKS